MQHVMVRQTHRLPSHLLNDKPSWPSNLRFTSSAPTRHISSSMDDYTSPLLPSPTRSTAPRRWRRSCNYALSQPSWLYPLKGLWYFSSHRFLHPLLRARLLPCALLSIFVLTILFTFAYLPQVAFLALFHGLPLAWVNAAFLVLGEGAAIVALIFEAFFVDETLVDIFDAVLITEGCEELVARRRIVLPAEEGNGNPVKRLGKPTASAIYSVCPDAQALDNWIVRVLPRL